VTDSSAALPLNGVRILDVAAGRLQTVGRMLADLGAEVLRVEPAEGSPDRRSGVVDDGVSLTFATRNANKGSVVVDVADRPRLTAVAADADLVLLTPTDTPFDPAAVRAARAINPRLVLLQLTDFGITGPMRDWLGTPAVHFALSSVLSRSGLPEVTEPLLPPEFLAYEAAAAQALWVAVLALAQARRTGEGDEIDFSVSEALIHILDPGMGIGGSARAGAPMRDLPRGRPDSRHLYPIFPAKDGYTRICVLSARQWQGMFRWLGEPEEFADPKYNNIGIRFGAAQTLYPLIGRMLAGLTREEATEAGQAYGVPVAGLASPSEVLATDAFHAAGCFRELVLPDGRTATVPTGPFEIDGERAGWRKDAPQLGDATGFAGDRTPNPAPVAAAGSQPFAGLRVLDLGVIVVGAELGRLLGDYGADVIKVESRGFPDGSRQSYDGSEMTEGFAWGHRNKRSLGLNLKDEEGKRIFRDLVAASDVVLTNFKPGTLESLGFGWDELQRINPRIVLSESSAFGNSGPWSGRLGYGPLVRASAGLSALWRYPHIEGSFSDSITIFPDHVVARLNAAAVTALLLRREQTGRGGRVSTAQVDAIFGAMADLLALESLRPGSFGTEDVERLDVPRGIFPAAGDDEWVVVDGAGDVRFQRLAHAIDRPELAEDATLGTAAGRRSRADELGAALTDWTTARTAREAAETLQAAGVPAGNLVRITEFESDPHLRARGFFGRFRQPQLAEDMPAMLKEAPSNMLPAPRLQPAPLMAEHTAEVMHDVLGLGRSRIDELIASGTLEIHPSARPAAATA
jgi:crotonobetainyl-CoA:carnitine CoA-transferase CaiB-like acyl-CoA transferase